MRVGNRRPLHQETVSANADTLATVQEIREEVGLLAKTIETRDVNITNHATKTDELCKITQAKCHETVASIELTVKNIGSQVDTKAIVSGISSALNAGIRKEVVTPLITQTEKLALEVLPTLQQIQASAAAAKSEWSNRIWKTAWTTSLSWSIWTAIIITCLLCLTFADYYEKKMAAQFAVMSRVMKYNQTAFQKLAIAQMPVKVLPAQSDDAIWSY